MVNERKIYSVEFTVIILLWTLVVISPLFFMNDSDKDWRAVHVMWSECMVVGVGFLINRFLLIPRLFFAKRYVAYIWSIMGLLALFTLFILCFDGVNLIVSIFGEYNSASAMPLHNLTPPFDPPPHMGLSHRGVPPMDVPPTNRVIPPMVSVLVASFIVMALDLGVRIASTWVITEQKQADINRERVVSQLQNLQSQVSPHFFMNTLNNIHALVDIDSARAKQTIIELSDLMSYLLYDCSQTDRVSLRKELDFISNYINLMRIRFSAQVEVKFSYDDNVPAVKIPPLLFVNFIENAFKYGVDSDQRSIINIKFVFTESTVTMRVLNSNHSSLMLNDKHGLGIINTRRRLDLIYGDNYTLDISEKEKIYLTTLKIPIQ